MLSTILPVNIVFDDKLRALPQFYVFFLFLSKKLNAGKLIDKLLVFSRLYLFLPINFREKKKKFRTCLRFASFFFFSFVLLSQVVQINRKGSDSFLFCLAPFAQSGLNNLHIDGNTPSSLSTFGSPPDMTVSFSKYR